MSSSEYLSTSFIGGWVTVLAVAGAMGYQYYSKSQPAAKKEKPTAIASTPKKQNRAKKQRQEAYSSAAQKAATEEAPVVPTPSAQPKKERDEESDNKAFAAQMANVKAGKKFDGKSNAEKKQKQKSVKQSRAAEPVQAKVVAEDEPTAPSSNDSANDVSSAAASPEVTPADPSGVSDMLEAAPSGPSVLRLTDTDKVKQKVKAAKAPEQVETKKQRQNRKKAEERKLAREEDEKERKVLMEKQRRTAREAAGVPAKDGSQFMASVGAKSAWNASANGSTPKKEETIDVQPLDTFESTTTDAPAASVAPAKPKDTAAWTSSLPSEEEQLEAAKAEDDAWATVPTKGSKKAKKVQSTEEIVPSAPVKEARPVPQPLPVNGTSNNKSNQSYGSFSALTVKDTGAQDDDEDVEETEWDV